jgi:hypothetical protein
VLIEVAELSRLVRDKAVLIEANEQLVKLVNLETHRANTAEAIGRINEQAIRSCEGELMRCERERKRWKAAAIVASVVAVGLGLALVSRGRR